MPYVRLRTITADNWREAMMLEVAKAQTEFVPSNLFSLAQAAYEHGYFACGVVDNADNGRMVGFVMYRALDFEDYTFWYIARFMIDRFQQGKGYGRGALHAVLRRLRHRHNADAVMITVVPQNAPAIALYESVGFVATGATWDDEVCYVLRFDSAST